MRDVRCEASSRISHLLTELHVLPLHELILELVPLELARGGHRNVIAEYHHLWRFRGRQLRTAERQHLLFRRATARLALAIRPDLLAVVAVLEPHRQPHSNTRALIQNLVDLKRREIYPAADDQLLDPPRDEVVLTAIVTLEHEPFVTA